MVSIAAMVVYHVENGNRGEGAMSSEALTWARLQIEAMGMCDVGATAVHVGTQAEVRVLDAKRTDGGGPPVKFVLKRFHPSPRSAEALRREVEALSAFHPGLADRKAGIRCPEPLSVSAENLAYLMTHVTGRPLDEQPPRARARQADIADKLATALSLFYRLVGGLYGDFQPQNVLDDGEVVSLIDPTLPYPVHLRLSSALRHAPASADLGYWLYTVAARAPKSAATRPRQHSRLLRTTEMIVLEGARVFAETSDQVEFVHEVADAAMTRLHRLAAATRFKGPMLRSCGAPVVDHVRLHAAQRCSADGRH